MTMPTTSSTTATTPHYKLIFTVPPSSLEKCKSAIFAKGAGTYPKGNYTNVCFETRGEAQFLPGEDANPAIGQRGTLERVEEVRVETLCVGEECVREAVGALKGAHPYEEPAYEVYRLENI